MPVAMVDDKGQITQVDPKDVSLAEGMGYKPVAEAEAKPTDTVDVLNKQTNVIEKLPHTEAGPAILSGSHELPQASEKVPMVEPTSGEIWQVPFDKVHEALSGSWQLAPTSAVEAKQTEERVAKKQAQIEKQGELGLGEGAAIDTALHNFGNTALFGIPEMIHAKDLQGHPIAQEEQRAREQAYNEHPVAGMLGTGAGFATQVLASEGLFAAGPGAIAKAAEGAIDNPILKAVAGKGIEGMAYVAPNAAAKAIIEKDPAAAAEDLALGGGLNVATHGIFHLPGVANDLIEKMTAAKTATKTNEEALRVAANTIGKELGVPASKIETLRENIPNLIKAANLTKEDTVKTAVEKIQKLEESGPNIGAAIKQLDTLPEKSGIIVKHLGVASEQLNAILPKVPLLTVEGIEKGIPEYLSPSVDQAKKALQPIIEEINATAQRGTFADTQALKRFVREQTNFSDNKYVNSLRQQAYGILRENLAKAEDEAATQIGDASIAHKLTEERTAYTLSNLFGSFADRTGAKEVLESPLSVIQHLHVGHHGFVGLVAHTLFGGPFAGPIAAGASIGLKLWKHAAANGRLGKAISAFTNPVEVVAKAQKVQQLHISEKVKDFLGNISANAAVDTRDHMTRTLAPWLRNGGVGKSSDQQLTELRKNVQDANKNPEAFANHLAAMTQPLREAGLDKVADAYTDHQIRLMKVMQAILPNDPSLQNSHPFATNLPMVISPATKMKYQRALTIAEKPEVLLDMIKTNNITPYDVAIAAAVNPATLQRMREELTLESIKKKPNLSYQHQLSLDILMGTKINEAAEPFPVLQAAYAPPPPMGSTGTPTGKKSKMNAKTEDNLDENSLTVSQKAQKL